MLEQREGGQRGRGALLTRTDSHAAKGVSSGEAGRRAARCAAGQTVAATSAMGVDGVELARGLSEGGFLTMALVARCKSDSRGQQRAAVRLELD